MTSEELNTNKLNRDREEIEFDNTLKLNIRIKKLKNSNNEDVKNLNKIRMLPDIKIAIANLRNEIDNYNDLKFETNFSPNTERQNNLLFEANINNGINRMNKLMNSPMLTRK